MAENVKLRAFSDLDDPVSGHVAGGHDFETTPELAQQYVKANWAGPAGTDARDIQLEVAAQEYEDRQSARQNVVAARQTFRNLAVNSFDRGNVGVAGQIPGTVGVVGSAAEQTTNQQVVAGSGEGKGENLKAGSATGEAGPDSENPDAQGVQQGDAGGGNQAEKDQYDEMNKEEVYEEAKARGLDVKKSQPKDELTQALREDDAS